MTLVSGWRRTYGGRPGSWPRSWMTPAGSAYPCRTWRSVASTRGAVGVDTWRAVSPDRLGRDQVAPELATATATRCARMQYAADYLILG